MKWLKRILIGILATLLLVAGGAYLYLKSNEVPLPEGVEGAIAEAMADEMLGAMGGKNWDDARIITFTFKGVHSYIWDRELNRVEVKWDDHRAVFNTTDHLSGKVWQSNTIVEGESARELLEKAWAYFCNDSFWLVAPFKIRDQGTTRKACSLENGGQGLLVTYESGGVTPGDSYLWILNEEGMPTAYRMWVSIIPIGGMEASWDGWITTQSGIQLATAHELPGFTLEITEVQACTDLASAGFKEDPFLD